MAGTCRHVQISWLLEKLCIRKGEKWLKKCSQALKAVTMQDYLSPIFRLFTGLSEQQQLLALGVLSTQWSQSFLLRVIDSLIALQGHGEGRTETWHGLLPALPCSCLSQQLQFLTTLRLEPLCHTRSRKSSINLPSVFPSGAAVFAQAGMHLLRKASAAYWRWTPFLCPSLEGSPHGDAATASCLLSISGKLADGSPAAPEPKHQPPLWTLTSTVKGATSVCKEKERKRQRFGSCSSLPLPPMALIHFGLWSKSSLKGKYSQELLRKRRKNGSSIRRKTNSVRYELLICSP